MFHLAETALGIPQFVVICDTKQIIAENQLAIFATLCVLKYATTSLDPSKYLCRFIDLLISASINCLINYKYARGKNDK